MKLVQIRAARVAVVVVAAALTLPAAGVAEAAVPRGPQRPAATKAVVRKPAAKVPPKRPAPVRTPVKPGAKPVPARPAAKPVPVRPVPVKPVTALPAPAAPTGAGLDVAPQLVTPPAAPVLPALVDAVLPASIPADCSADVSGAVNAWLTGLPASGVRVVLPTGGCLRVERTVTVSGRSGWVVDGRGTELRRTEATPADLRYPRNNRHFAVVDSSDVVVRDLRVTGLNTERDARGQDGYASYVRDLEFEHAFSVWASRRVLLEGLQARSTFGDGIYLHADTTDVTVRGGRIALNGRQGIGILGSRVLVDGIDIASSRRSGIDLEPDTAGMSDVEVRNSTIASHLLAFASGGAGDVDRVHLHHNTISQTGVPFVYASRPGFSRDDWTITDNWVQTGLGSPMAAIRLWNAARAVVARNVIPVAESQSRAVLDISAGTDVDATCNSLRNAKDDFVLREDGGGTARARDNATGPVPPACLDIDRVGAPRQPEPVRTTNDYWSAATPVPALAPGQDSRRYPVDNAGYTTERFEQGTFGLTGRTAWFTYRTGDTAETVRVTTTGRLRSIKVVSGPSLFWSLPVDEAHNSDSLTVRLAARTVFHVQLDDSSYVPASDAARTVTFHRGTAGNDDVEGATPVPTLSRGQTALFEGDTTAATQLPGEPGCPCFGRSLWYAYTAVGDQDLVLQATGSFNVLSVLDASDRSKVGESIWSRALRVSLKPGRYLVRVDATDYNGNLPGPGTLRLGAV